MRQEISQRFILAKEMFRRPWFRAIFAVWAFISFWDTFVSELLPEKVAASAPRVYKIFFWLLEMTSGWIPLWGWLLVGMALLVALSIEFTFRWTIEEQRRLQYLGGPSENVEKGMLDYLVDGTQAMQDITKTINSASGDTVRFTRMLNRYSRIVPYITNFKLRRRILGRVASHINAYSDRLQKTADFIKVAIPVVRDNQTKFIEGCVFSSQSELINLTNLSAAADATIQSTLKATEGLEQMREGAKLIRGISGDLNYASNRLVAVISDVIERVVDFGSTTGQVRNVALKKFLENSK